MIDNICEWIFENHPIIFDLIVVILLFAISWMICGVISDQIICFKNYMNLMEVTMDIKEVDNEYHNPLQCACNFYLKTNYL